MAIAFPSLKPGFLLGASLVAALVVGSGWQLHAHLAPIAPDRASVEAMAASTEAALPATDQASEAGTIAYGRGGDGPWEAGTSERGRAAEPLQAEATTGAAVRYTVQPGDTLSTVAERFNTRVSRIVALNPGLQPDLIRIGQVLDIPANAATDERTETPILLPPDVLEAAVETRSYLWAPYRSQFDGSPYEGGNCGPAALAMAMARFGEWWSTEGLRRSINRVTGDWSYDGGSDWPSMVAAATERGFEAHGPFNEEGGFRYWDLDDLLAHTEQGRPVILLVRYRALPGHENAAWYGDHYIVFLGLTRDGGVVYHDPAFQGDEGAYRIMEQATLDRAWSHTWIHQNRTAMAINWPRR